MNDTAELANPLLAQRWQRILDAIALKEPDKVPFSIFNHFWPATYAGFDFRTAMYDHEKFFAATRDVVIDLEPDMYLPPNTNITMGRAMEIMGYRQLEWPGHGLGDDAPFQYLDKEYMSADEYDDYVFDPTGFFLHTYLPRVAEAFEVFKSFPQYPTLYYFKIIRSVAAFARPAMKEGLDRLAEAGDALRGMDKDGMALINELEDLGFPISAGGGAAAPFDHFADYLRGSKGAMLDMFRHPDKLLAAMEKASVLIARDAIRTASRHPYCKIVFMPMHWGLDGFMSPDQFETFFWPQLRDVMMRLIEADLVPCLLWEGKCDTRLETMADIPPGKVIYWFEQTDMFRAKDVLGDIACLRGNVPADLLVTGNPDEVDDYCKKLIEKCAKGGGLIVDGGIGIPDEAKVENVRAMAQATKKYNVGG